MTTQQAPRSTSARWLSAAPEPSSSSGTEAPPSRATTYADLVMDRVEERGKRVDRGVHARARDLAEAIGAADGGPRDVVDLHTAVVGRLTEATDHQRTSALVASAQLVLAEVLGHLASHYRRRAVEGASA